MHCVHAGYLPGKKLSDHHIESTSAHHPLCIELIDAEERLRKFLHEHAEELRHAQAVLFRCELAL
jgi:PII-like signaling protein